MKKYHGKPYNFKKAIVGKVTKKELPLSNRRDYILLCYYKPENIRGYGAVISTTKLKHKFFSRTPIISEISEISDETLNDGDIIILNDNGEITLVWEANSNQNCILITEECNCRCLMCPQPPRKDSHGLNQANQKIINLIDPKITKGICLTGGEPSLFPRRFFETLKILNEKFPNTTITILTNGKQFGDFDFTKDFAKVGRNTVICVSLNADTDYLHDKITRSKGSFNKSVKGIYNLAKFNQKIEIRYVVSKLNYERLESFANFVYRNFPFVMHIAFMGLEISGYAEDNFHKIWVEPIEYKSQLKNAVLELNKRAMNVSIYNIPLCLLSADVWNYSRKSISAWKNEYLTNCQPCTEIVNCCGIFTTSAYHSQNIEPIKIKKIIVDNE